MVIYADVLLAVNWWVDFLLLTLLRRLTGARARGWRLALGAFCGGLTAFVLLLPPLPVWLSLLCKAAGAVLMVLIAFPPESGRCFLRRILWLFALSAGLAGLCEGLYYFFAPPGIYVSNGVVYYRISPLLLVGLTVLCYGILCLISRRMRRAAPQRHRYTVSVSNRGRTVTLPCLYDSGNHLVEPFSGAPIIVMEKNAVSSILPDGLDEAHLPAAPGWRMIPFSSLGGQGLLPAFRPERVTVHSGRSCDPSGQGDRLLPGCYIALSSTLLPEDYKGLLGNAAAEFAADPKGVSLCGTD